MSQLPWPAIHSIRNRINRLVIELDETYIERAKLMRRMRDAGMSQRQIGDHWGISKQAVQYVLNGRPKKVTR